MIPEGYCGASNQHTREPFVDATTAAAFLSITIKYLLHLARKGRVPAYPISTGSKRHIWRFKISELEDLPPNVIRPRA
jgi:hypothetical protein